MTTNIEIISDSLREINVISEVAEASSEQGKKGLRKLNQMLEIWRENDIDFGWFKQLSTTDVAPVPDWAELGVVSMLAIALAPTYGASVSAELGAVADTAYGMIQRKSISEKLDNTDMTQLPEGQGHWRNRYNIETDT